MNISAHGIGPGSPNPIISVARTIGAKYLISVNSIELCQAAQGNGFIPIDRWNRPPFMDDDADHHFDNPTYVDAVHGELAAWGISPRWIYDGNELTNSQPERTSNWLIAGAKHAYALGDTLVMANFYNQGPGDAFFQNADVQRAMKVIADTGMVLGFHRGATGVLDTFDKALAGGAIGGFEQLQRDYPGIRIAVTEFGATKDNKGYLTWYADRYSALVKQAYDYYGEHGVLFMAHFTVMPWSVSPGFELDGNPTLQQDMHTCNQEVIVVQPTTPDRTTLGAPLDAVITHTASDVVNVRADVTTTSAVLTTLKTGDAIRVRPTPTAKVNGYQWYAIETPVVGWAANVFTWSAQVKDTPLSSVGVPYYSQLAPSANLRINDCLVACCRMLLGWAYVWKDLGDPPFITVNDMTLHTPLAGADKPLSVADGVALLKGYGISAHASTALDQAGITAELMANRPCILLVSDKQFGGKGVGHFVVPEAVGSAGFWVNDPDIEGASFYLTFADMNAAQIGVVPTYASAPYQGIVLTP